MSGDSDYSRPAAGAAAQVALNTHDILCQIFQVDRHFRPKLSRKDLFRCALVSRAFCEPVLRRLWRDMSPPDPLWLLLAPTGMSSTLEDLTSDLFDVVLSERTYADPARWSRFMWYARFVQKLDIMTLVSADPLKQQLLIRTLIEHNGGESIFPSLQTLWWSPSSHSDSSYFPPFTPQIRSAPFSFPSPKQEDIDREDKNSKSSAFLARLRASSSRLSYLYLDMCRERIGPSYSRIISSFEHLTRVNLIASISLTSFRELATMPRMKSLQITYVSSNEPGPSHHPIVPIYAPRLKLISIRGNCPSLTQLFTALHAPALRSASLYAMCDSTSGDYVSCIEALATVGASSTMEALHIELEEGCSDDGWPAISAPTTHQGVSDLLGPLHVFCKAKRVSLACPTLALVAADHDFDVLARAWPKLRTFELDEAYWAPRMGTDGDEAIPTPKLLESFRDHCPHLRELTLPHLDLEADVPEPKPYFPKAGRGSRHRLKHLSFGAKDPDGDSDDSDDSDEEAEDEDEASGEAAAPALDGEKAAAWARYILALFPKLDATYGHAECKIASATGWAEVFARVRGLRKARKDVSSSDCGVTVWESSKCL
ncbi:hypothetical protein LXA43DRAFT_1080284 [Ganoderma leucocontextum]|nr:hypothetical protein LXA43DRAFT_1080284 [Ganoderma leucocontextum]